jgi:hypothetical protein
MASNIILFYQIPRIRPTVYRFKLHLSPTSMSSVTSSNGNVTYTIPPLPKGKSVVNLFADFMLYLYQCTKTYIHDTHVSGEILWASFEHRIEYVLTHPNGWEGAQQEQMRKAAILAGLVPDTVEGRARIQFVTEGEASLHFCIQNGLTTQAMKVLSTFLSAIVIGCLIIFRRTVTEC